MNADIPGIQSDLRRRSWTAAFLRFSRARSDRAAHPGPSGGDANTRWFYFVPRKGTPKKLSTRLSAVPGALPGESLFYAGQESFAKMSEDSRRAKNVAMQYSPKNAIPYVAMWMRARLNGARQRLKVVSSADLVQKYELAE